MKWTKETLRYSCIKCESLEHGKKIIEFYKSFGFNAGVLQGISIGWFYGPAEMDCMKVRQEFKHSNFLKIIELPKQRRKFPREMMVSDDGVAWYTRTVLAKCSKLHYPFITASPPYKQEDSFQIRMRNWKYAKEISAKKTSLNSLKDLANLKKKAEKGAKEVMSEKQAKTNGTVILFETESQRDAIIDFYKGSMKAMIANGNPGQGEYYGCDENGCSVFTRNPEFMNREIIKLPESFRKFPRKMLVSNDGTNWKEETIHGIIEGVERPFVYGWFGKKYAKEID